MKDEESPKNEPKRTRLTLRGVGQFHHHAEDAEQPCVTDKPAKICGCGILRA